MLLRTISTRLYKPQGCRAQTQISVEGSPEHSRHTQQNNMFKLVVLSVLVAVAAAKPSSPLLAALVGEKTIESHGNSVVHASAQVLSAAAPALVSAPVLTESAVAYAAPATLVHEKTIESHGNSVVHASAPLVAAAAPAPLLYTSYAAPVVAEKTISSYGHSVVHHGGPAIAHHTAYIAPAISYY